GLCGELLSEVFLPLVVQRVQGLACGGGGFVLVVRGVRCGPVLPQDPAGLGHGVVACDGVLPGIIRELIRRGRGGSLCRGGVVGGGVGRGQGADGVVVAVTDGLDEGLVVLA